MTDKRVTITTVANEVGMSIAAVSRAFDKNSKLKPEKRALILETAKRLGYVPNKMAARLSGKAVRIGVLIYGHIPAYFEEHAAGIRHSCRELADYKIDCDLAVLRRGEVSGEEAYGAIDRFVSEGCDGVILAGFENDAEFSRLNRLAEAGIPFLLLDHDLPGCRRSGVCRNDADTAGRMAAQLLCAAVRERRKTAVLCSHLTNMTQKRLADAFCSAAARYGLDAPEVYPTGNDPETAAAITKELLQRGEIGGIYVSSANSIPVCKAIEAAAMAGSIGLVTSDVFPELGQYLKNGTVFATIHQDPFRQAKQAFEALFYHILEQRPLPEQILVNPIAVFDSNLNLYL